MLAATSDYTHFAAALGYSLFAILLIARVARTSLARLLIVAALATTAWAALAILADSGSVPEWMADASEPVRDGCWFVILLAMLRPPFEGQRIWLGLSAATCALLVIDLLFQIRALESFRVLGLSINAPALRIATSIIGLVLVENLLRNASTDRLWAVKFLAIGLLFLLGSELLLRIPEVLSGDRDTNFVAVRPLIFVMVLPLFVVTAVRSPAFRLQIHSSRQIVVHLATLIGVGVVLQGTALAALYVRTYGGSNGTVLAIVLSSAALIATAVLIASAAVRARLRAFINENFFSYKYDYRREWDRFIRSMSSWEEQGLSMRALRTLADLLDSPGGVLWRARDEGKVLVPAAASGSTSDHQTLLATDLLLAPFAKESCAYLDLTGTHPAANGWRRAYPHFWLVIPLRHHSSIVGLVLLDRPLAPHRIDWEDRNLIEIVALQLGAYLVQEDTALALADAQQLEEFNKRFAFALHDIKNTIGQLSLLVRNAEQFGDDEEFQKDMVLTVDETVTRLQNLLTKLKAAGGAPPATTPTAVDMGRLIGAFIAGQRRLGQGVVQVCSDTPTLALLGDSEAFVTVLDHVVGNALDVTPPGEHVTVRVIPAGERVRVSIEDHGPGMTRQFIEEELFRPLRSTKNTGFGIGAFQAREVMRQLGGDIDVASEVGSGTRFDLLLPRALVEREVVGA